MRTRIQQLRARRGLAFPVVGVVNSLAAEKEAIRARKSHSVAALVEANVLMGCSRNCRLHSPPLSNRTLVRTQLKLRNLPRPVVRVNRRTFAKGPSASTINNALVVDRKVFSEPRRCALRQPRRRCGTLFTINSVGAARGPLNFLPDSPPGTFNYRFVFYLRTKCSRPMPERTGDEYVLNVTVDRSLRH